ncbi:MAG: AAA family ATPase [Candidatus Shapirobacteria bacterium]|jgi:dephospho-CoA kinase|nr:AAA family ATPase [Candidatus Shapirobacteria bacterium]
MIIIGITGTNGAGKGTIVEYLVKNKGFEHFSARAFIVEEIERRGLENNRDNMVMVANDLRAKNSPSFVADELFKRALESRQNCVIESLRTLGEIESLKKKGKFVLLAVDAEPRLRYQRVVQRLTSTDNITFEEFLSQEEREMTSNDPNKQNLKKCIESADFLVKNEETIEQLNLKIEEILKIIEI